MITLKTLIDRAKASRMACAFSPSISLRWRWHKAVNPQRQLTADLRFYLTHLPRIDISTVMVSTSCLSEQRFPAANVKLLFEQLGYLKNCAQNTKLIVPPASIELNAVTLERFLNTGASLSAKQYLAKVSATGLELLASYEAISQATSGIDNFNATYLLRYLTALLMGLTDFYGYFHELQ